MAVVLSATFNQGLDLVQPLSFSRRPVQIRRLVTHGGDGESRGVSLASILCSCSLGVFMQQRRRSSVPSVRLAIKDADTDTASADTKRKAPPRFKLSPAAAAWKPSEEAEVAEEAALMGSWRRKLVAEVEILHLEKHPELPSELAIAEVEDPDFPGARLLLVVEQDRWSVKDKGFLLKVGCKVPRKAGNFGEAFRQLAGEALMQSQGAMEGPLKMSISNKNTEGIYSQGLLLPLKTETYDSLEALSEQVEETKAFQSSLMIQISFRGDDAHTSSSVETKLKTALLQLGCLPPWSDVKWDRLSPSERAVHARSYRVGLPNVRVQSSDLQADGSCPELAKALNRRLNCPEELLVQKIERMPSSTKLSQVCSAREYRFYLHRSWSSRGGDPDEAVEQRLAETLKLCEGSHCFINFCKLTQAMQEELWLGEETRGWFLKMNQWKKKRKAEDYPESSRFGDDEWSAIPEAAKRMCTASISTCEVMGPCGSDDQLRCIRIVSDSFLYMQVRLLIGSCCAAALGVVPLDVFKRALEGNVSVDFMEYVAPPIGLVLHSQSTDNEKAPWMSPESSASVDRFFEDRLMWVVERAWARNRSLGDWHTRRRDPFAIAEEFSLY